MYKNDQLTEIAIRHIEHSECVDAASESTLASDLPKARSCLCVCTLDPVSNVMAHWDIMSGPVSNLKLLRLFCHDRLHSIRILTHRNIISSPPRKSIPNCTISPSLTGNGRDSTLGWLSRMWLRKVPDELRTSLIYHCPWEHQNSQCLRLTTFDLNPTGADEGAFEGGLGFPSRSE